ncbi:DnaT-like ssDNA-binding protein [uncultured Desulfovibrio sp.]|uniref:DnaT-like ssDNA-binding protein n=1 Tax=uncultured Desulfovibrio sp. TaxID=167968 RepID=UPI00272C14F5|nr:DnaT-like ssDNA-binding protein [uncultured Desulfovibrio sp.]
MLIVEDGSCPEGAASYVSLEEADAYLIPRGLWPVTAAEVMPDNETGEGEEQPDTVMLSAKKAALVRAFDYLNGPLDWKGIKIDWEREPAWPRLNVPIPNTDPARREYIPENVVPGAVKRAQMELAALLYAGKDMLAPRERGGAVVAESHSKTEGGVDVIGGDSESHSYTYADNAPAEDWLPSVYPMLKPFLNSVPGKERGGLTFAKVARG